jgi:hypothetical protein
MKKGKCKSLEQGCQSSGTDEKWGEERNKMVMPWLNEFDMLEIKDEKSI